MRRKSIASPNGAGKSTLIDIAAGVLLPDSGKVLVNGRDIHADFRAKSLLTTVFQETTFDAMMTPKDALMFHAKMLGIRNARTKIEEIMTLLKVDGFQSKRIFELSGGTRRKVEVAKAFISETPVYLLDEPTNGLDRTSREIVWDRIRTLAARGSAIVIVSHDTREAFTLASKTLELNDGVLEPYQKRAVNLAVSRLTVSFGRFPSRVLDELRSLPSVLSATVKKSSRTDPDKLVEHLRDQGAIPVSGNVSVVYLDSAEELLKSLGIDGSQVIKLPMPDLAEPAEVEIEMEDVDLNLSGLLKWAADQNLQVVNVAIDRNSAEQRKTVEGEGSQQ
ncbi:MAG TPA: ABC transporter ATP-binding protein [Firmicutes bacterium]|nr:ABC transporter ATP-binding protein [Candidatus Fermentithermobacillaceae bacterium]